MSIKACGLDDDKWSCPLMRLSSGAWGSRLRSSSCGNQDIKVQCKKKISKLSYCDQVVILGDWSGDYMSLLDY